MYIMTIKSIKSFKRKPLQVPSVSSLVLHHITTCKKISCDYSQLTTCTFDFVVYRRKKQPQNQWQAECTAAKPKAEVWTSKRTLKGSEKHGADQIMMKGNEWNGYQFSIIYCSSPYLFTDIYTVNYSTLHYRLVFLFISLLELSADDYSKRSASKKMYYRRD